MIIRTTQDNPNRECRKNTNHIGNYVNFIKNDKYHSDRNFGGPQKNSNRDCNQKIIQIGNQVDPYHKLQISFRSEIRWTPKITQIGNEAKIYLFQEHLDFKHLEETRIQTLALRGGLYLPTPGLPSHPIHPTLNSTTVLHPSKTASLFS